MRYMKPQTESAIGCLSVVFWPLTIPMIVFNLIYREKRQKPYADPKLAKERNRKPKKKSLAQSSEVDPWELPPEKMPWEK